MLHLQYNHLEPFREKYDKNIQGSKNFPFLVTSVSVDTHEIFQCLPNLSLLYNWMLSHLILTNKSAINLLRFVGCMKTITHRWYETNCVLTWGLEIFFHPLVHHSRQVIGLSVIFKSFQQSQTLAQLVPDLASEVVSKMAATKQTKLSEKGSP